MITETVITTVDQQKKLHFAAVGVEILANTAKFYLYNKSTTISNLKTNFLGVINIVDKAEYLLKAALSSEKIDTLKVKDKELYYLADCCSYYQFKVLNIKSFSEKYLVEAEISAAKENRKFIGLNRANNLLIEAAVIASRIGITKEKKELVDFLNKNKRVILKTGDKETEKLINLLESI